MKKSFLFFFFSVIIVCAWFAACSAKTDPARHEEDSIVLTPRQRQTLKHNIIRESRKLPFPLGTFGMVRHMMLKGHHMRMTVEISPNFYDLERINREPEVIKRSLMDNLARMNDSFDPLFALLSRNHVGLRVELDRECSDDVCEIYVSPQELQQLSRQSSRSVNLDTMLKNHAAAYNVSLPILVFHKATLTRVDVEPGYMVYNFNIAEDIGNEMYRLRSGKLLWAGKVREALLGATDSAVQEVVRLCRQTKRNVFYRFTGEKTGIQVTVRIYLTSTK